MMEPLFDLVRGLQQTLSKVVDNQLEIITRLKSAEIDIIELRASIKKSLEDEAKANIKKGWLFDGRRLG